MRKSPVRVHAHPPERRRRQTVTLPCGCCCCCCCCLHTLGGLIGAAIGSNIAPPVPRPYEGDEQPLDRHGRPLFWQGSRSGVSAAAVYWYTLLALIGLTVALSCAGGALRGHADTFAQGPLWAILILALFLPGIQLLASVIAIFLAAVTDWDNAAARVWTVAKITFGTVIGTGIGLGIMVLAFVALTMR